MNTCLTLAEELEQEIFDEGIMLLKDDLSHLEVDGLYYNSNIVPFPVITISGSIDSESNSNVVKAHELGHHNTSLCDSVSSAIEVRRREESRARRWEIYRLMPVEKLIDLYERGISTPFEMVDWLDIPIDEFLYGLKLYEDIYGPRIIEGQYIITWSPFNIKKDRRRRNK